MNWFLLSFLGTAGAIVVACCIVALFLRHRINRRHRVHPKIPTPAPLTWMADPRAAARLHRRLAKVGHTAGDVADDHRLPQKKLRRPVEQPEMVALAEELRRQAVNLDHQVARTAGLPSSVRRSHLSQLASSVAEAEFACVRLVSVSTQARTPSVLAHGSGVDITDVAGQVERLAEAHRILTRIDERSGLAPAPAPPVATQSAR
ncbi:hypothetical protein ACE2AJ_20835 [Aquihabitans daechungensis]|uniref:hypothetical protein n=1 Tax=Aquihabitans daechungensis TaxID=1052257 RepID=UPI003BA1F8B1